MQQLEKDERLVLLLGDIGVFGFRKAIKSYPDRVYNIGILEQSTVSLAAGLAMDGLIPVVHTIAPFLIERSLEQIKVDFCYQKLGGNFISVGASYDYAALGCTHHCPADVGILRNLPGMEIIVPGTSSEFDTLFRQTYSDQNPTYFRLSERENPLSYNVRFGKAEIVKKGSLATIIAIGPTLKPILEAIEDMDVTVLYYTTIAPFDGSVLKENNVSSKILICEPYYCGALLIDILNALKPKPTTIDNIGIPHTFLTNYGQAHEHDEFVGLTMKNIKEHIMRLIYG